jgi:cytoskeletal protein CcmA (bactofilin family)
LTGRAKVAGAVELDQLTVRGDLSVAGPVTADRWDAVGRTLVEGDGKGTGDWRLHGESRFGGGLSAGSLTVDGRLDVRGGVQVTGGVSVRGSLDVGTDLKTGPLQVDGALSVVGAATATTFRLMVRGPSKADRIKADQVTIDRKSSPFDRDPPVLEVLEIEAQEVHLTGVVAQYVKAPRVTLGPGCRIAQVDGTVVARDPKSHVGPQVRSAPPYGLSR